ncbi:MAG: hypothetical protein ACFFCM_22770 [Promethearchaeota archaeon]
MMIIEILKKSKKKINNRQETCLDCPSAIIQGKVDFNCCCQILDKEIGDNEQSEILIKCSRRPELGLFEPNFTIQQCQEWIKLKKTIPKKRKD